jgi:hypothetical protein
LKSDNLTQPQITGVQIDFGAPVESTDYIQFDVPQSTFNYISSELPAADVPADMLGPWSTNVQRWMPYISSTPIAASTLENMWENPSGNQKAMLAAWKYYSGAGNDFDQLGNKMADPSPLADRISTAFYSNYGVPKSVTTSLETCYLALPTVCAYAEVH